VYSKTSPVYPAGRDANTFFFIVLFAEKKFSQEGSEKKSHFLKHDGNHKKNDVERWRKGELFQERILFQNIQVRYDKRFPVFFEVGRQ
jgi:hypothetical protein